MRSPWQLIKGLVSGSKSDEASATADEAVATSDPQVEVSEQRNAPQRELEAQPGTNVQSTAGGNETDRHLPSIEADAQQPLPAVQTDPLPLQAAGNVAREGRERPALVVPLDGKGASGTLTTGSNERRAKAPHARGNLRKGTMTAVEQPVATKKTAVDAAVELDLEIESLRLLLSAKLLEQNKQLRRMIGRYGNK
jgi:hypothetical protein